MEEIKKCTFKNLNLEVDEHQIAVLTINRPETLNAINEEVMDELCDAADYISAQDDIRGLIITGAGKAFVAGADIAVQSRFSEQEGFQWGKNGNAVFRLFELMDIPVIAAVNGFALGGGCELALACDIIIAGDKAKFGQPEVSLGITPGFGGTQRLMRKIGTGKAKELIFSGRMIQAEEAERIGLAERVVPNDELIPFCKEMLLSFAKNAPKAVAYAKKAMNEGSSMGLEDALLLESRYFSKCFATEDQKEGMHAFLEKRKAEFKNK